MQNMLYSLVCIFCIGSKSDGSGRGNMDGLNRWPKRKPIGLVIMAQEMGVSAEPCVQFVS